MSVQLLQACCCGEGECETFSASGCTPAPCPPFGTPWLELLKLPPFGPGSGGGRVPVYFVAAARAYRRIISADINCSAAIQVESFADPDVSLDCTGVGFSGSGPNVPCSDTPPGNFTLLSRNFGGGITSATSSPFGFTLFWSIAIASGSLATFQRAAPSGPVVPNLSGGYAITESSFFLPSYVPGVALFRGSVAGNRPTSSGGIDLVSVQAQVAVGPFVSCRGGVIEACPPAPFVWDAPPDWFDGQEPDEPLSGNAFSGGNESQSLGNSDNVAPTTGCGNCGNGGVL